MERKKTQRIIGILVVFALIVIVIPLLFGRNDVPMQEASNIKAPPFPDQQTLNADKNTAVTVAAATPADPNANAVTNPAATTAETSQVVNVTPGQQVEVQENTAPVSTTTAAAPTAAQAPAPGAPLMQADNTSVAQTAAEVPNAPVSATVTPETAKPVATASSAASPKPVAATPAESPKPDNANSASIIYERPSANEAASTAPVTTPDSSSATTPNPSVGISNTPVATAEPVNVVKKEQRVQKPDAQTIPTLKLKPAIHEQGRRVKPTRSIMAKNAKNIDFNKLKTAWAIQMGSFKVRKNAVNLAQKLRAAGYKAFTREFKSAKGGTSTRVYIGPELKQASAAKLSSDVRQHFNMQGMVIPYKPIET